MFGRSPSVVVLPGQTRTEYVTREVHEHRAPTDESVKLLNEMQQKAEANRIAAMALPANSFGGHREAQQDPASYKLRAIAVFDLNGRRITVEAEQHMDDNGGVPFLLVELHRKTAERIAAEILEPFILTASKAQRLP